MQGANIMEYNIAVIKGDGIGPEIVNEAMKVLKAVGKVYNHKFNFKELLAGGCAIDAAGISLPDETLAFAKNSDAVLLGAVGGPKWDNVESNNRPEKALLRLREELGLFCNLRPAKIYEELIDASPLKSEIVKDVDILVVRELTGGIYFGEKKTSDDGKYAYDMMCYSEEEIIRIARLAFASALLRKKHVTLVDKSNVLETSKLWRRVVSKLLKDYPEINLDYMYVDNAAMQLVKSPSMFDVILTENMFGDILSDELSMITGSIGLLSSASLREDNFGMYEPIHGSAPDIANQNIANPIATILSAALMLRHTFALEKEARSIENAVREVIKNGLRTPDIYSNASNKKIGTIEMGDEITKRIK